MAPRKSKGKSGVISARLRDKTALAPAVLGFSNLVEPDDKFGEPKYRALFHFSEEQTERNIEVLKEVLEKLIPKYADEAGIDASEVELDVEEYVRSRLKEASEKMRCQDPFMAFSLPAKEGVSKKTGKPYKITPRAWDRKNQMLDLAKLRLGGGSLVQPIVSVGLFTSPMVKDPCFSIRLEGVRILKLEQYGGGGLDSVSDDDLDLIEDAELDDDLSAFLESSEDDQVDNDEGEDGEDNPF